MEEIKALTELITRFRDARDWGQFHRPKDMALSLILEAAELAEHFQWKNEEEIASYMEKEGSAVGDELADVFYWVLLMAHDLKIDLHSAFIQKMAKNEEKYPVSKTRGVHTKYSELP